MAEQLEIQFLPAREGDAIWVRWPGHQMLIDMGVAATGRAIAERIRDLAEERRVFELLIVSHVDRDHIAGVLSGVVDNDDPIQGLTFNDVWFNGWEHLNGESVALVESPIESWSAAQGQELAVWLEGGRWNGRFNGGPVRRDGDLHTETFPGGLTLTIFGPTETGLEAMIPEWEEVYREFSEAPETPPEVPSGIESMGSRTPPELASLADLEQLAATKVSGDTAANGSSISVLLEWEGNRVLLPGDAHPEDIIDAARLMSPDEPLHVDAFKLPHHGSKNNVTSELVHAVTTDQWVFSTDGNRFRHPDAVAIARILLAARSPDLSKPNLVFNVPSKYNRWWDDDDWRRLFGYDTTFGDRDDGITLTFDPK